MTASTRTLALALGVLTVGATSAHADVVPARDYRPPARIGVRFSGVSVQRGDAPAPDRGRVLADVRSALHAGQARLDRCVEGLVSADDPLRSRRRTLTARLAFDRSARPTGASIVRATGVPPAARRCIDELLRSIRVSVAPRGSVELRVRYVLVSRARR